METTEPQTIPEFVAAGGLLGPHEDIPHPSEESPPEAQETPSVTDSEGADCD